MDADGTKYEDIKERRDGNRMMLKRTHACHKQMPTSRISSGEEPRRQSANYGRVFLLVSKSFLYNLVHVLK